MGIFSDNVVRLHEAGLSVIPVGDKKNPVFKDWPKYCLNRPTDKEIELWEKQQTEMAIGLCMGPASGLVAFDFDYEFDTRKSTVPEKQFMADKKAIETHILSILPPTPAIKVGKKGWTRIYKWSHRIDENSNVQADRYGVRLFDFLAWHKQTLIPPSLHSLDGEKAIYYKWIGDDLIDCLDDIPEIDPSIPREIKSMYGDGGGYDDTSRHGKLFKFLMGISRVENDEEKLIKALIAKDIEVNGNDSKGAYLQDQIYWKGKSPHEVAKNWVKRVLKWKLARSDKKTLTNVESKTSAEAWDYFFSSMFPSIKKEYISQDLYFKKDEPGAKYEPLMNYIGTIKSFAFHAGLPDSKAEQEFERYEFQKIKREFLFDIHEWDGVDRVGDFGKYLKCKSLDANDVSMIFKDWGASMFRRVYDSAEQNRCLILKGGQGLGKDSFVRSFLSHLDGYFSRFQRHTTEVDAWSQAVRNFVILISEFDQTNVHSVAFLKDLITRDVADYRDPYSRKAKKRPVAASFIATANVDAILRDSTGNRRFIILDVESIDWSYPKDWSAQVIAQFHHLYIERYRLPQYVADKLANSMESYQPEDMESVLLSAWEEIFKRDKGTFNCTKNAGCDATTFTKVGYIVQELSRISGWKQSTILNLLRRTGYSKRTNTGVLYYESSLKIDLSKKG